ncbi:NmrA family NAD(P)-binding protein [Streptomyces sp. NPDC053427]|uniref:NmrA family NAD(P)-binding protein n=1 Tax=Streptomyces sp. NPDC053427 TaxID=3365701 RepID=UPI0037D385DD
MDRTVLVTGATGRQGGAAAARLLADGWRVRVLVREGRRAAVGALAGAGAEVVIGDLDDPASLAAAAEGAYGVFGVTPDDADLDREMRRGDNLATAAATAGVRHFVFASVGGAERPSGIGYWAAKRAVEERIAALGLPATVLRPVRFMENHTIPGLPLGGITDQGELIHLFPPDVPVQLVATRDIGVFAALAFARPETYLGRALELAGDELTSRQVVGLLSEFTGRPVTYRQASPPASAPLSPEATRAFADPAGLWRADIPALRALHPGLMDFRTWLTTGGATAVSELLRGRQRGR